MTAAAQAANGDMLAKYDYVNPTAIRRLVANGAQLRPFSPEIMNACFEAAQATYAESERQQCRIQEDLRRQMAYRKDAFLWEQIADFTYDTFMMAQQRNGKLG